MTTLTIRPCYDRWKQKRHSRAKHQEWQITKEQEKQDEFFFNYFLHKKKMLLPQNLYDFTFQHVFLYDLCVDGEI